MIEVSLHNETDFEVSRERLESVVRKIAVDHGYQMGEVSLAIVDDPTIHRLNREHLQHDYPTDVLSFLWESHERLEGEVIVSADTATANAAEYHWPPQDEVLLYIIHGTLHLVGYDDHSPGDRETMRNREADYLRWSGVNLPTTHSRHEPQDQEAAP